MNIFLDIVKSEPGELMMKGELNEKNTNQINRREVISRFLEERKKRKVSLRVFSNEIDIPFYTLRDWYRSKKYNPEWDLLHNNRTRE